MTEHIVLFDAYGSKLLEKANSWLKDNGDVRVRNCETITWMSHDVQQLGNSEQMVLTKQLAEGKHTYYSRGLRYDAGSIEWVLRLRVAIMIRILEILGALCMYVTVSKFAQFW